MNPKNTTGGYVLIDTIGTQWFTAVIKDYDGQELLRGTWDSTGGFTSVISSPWVILPAL